MLPLFSSLAIFIVFQVICKYSFTYYTYTFAAFLSNFPCLKVGIGHHSQDYPKPIDVPLMNIDHPHPPTNTPHLLNIITITIIIIIVIIIITIIITIAILVICPPTATKVPLPPVPVQFKTSSDVLSMLSSQPCIRL